MFVVGLRATKRSGNCQSIDGLAAERQRSGAGGAGAELPNWPATAPIQTRPLPPNSCCKCASNWPRFFMQRPSRGRNKSTNRNSISLSSRKKICRGKLHRPTAKRSRPIPGSTWRQCASHSPGNRAGRYCLLPAVQLPGQRAGAEIGNRHAMPRGLCLRPVRGKSKSSIWAKPTRSTSWWSWPAGKLSAKALCWQAPRNSNQRHSRRRLLPRRRPHLLNVAWNWKSKASRIAEPCRPWRS